MSDNQTLKTVINMIRKFLRDKPKLNELIRKVENDDEDIIMAIQLAISDWNTTPPFLEPVKLENFPSLDWLILASSMYILESAGVLNYRNELPYNDGGITVSRWSKGPNYIGMAGMFANMVEKKKIEFKIALNYSNTFGIIRTPEFMLWDYSGLYTGPDYDGRSSGFKAATGTDIDSMSNNTISDRGKVDGATTPSKTLPFMFQISDWEADTGSQSFVLKFYHNLMADVDVRITDPNTGTDLRNKVSIRFKGQSLVELFVPMNPDGRISGSMIAFKI